MIPLAVGHIGRVDLLVVHSNTLPCLVADSQDFLNSFLGINLVPLNDASGDCVQNWMPGFIIFGLDLHSQDDFKVPFYGIQQ